MWQTGVESAEGERALVGLPAHFRSVFRSETSGSGGTGRWTSEGQESSEHGPQQSVSIFNLLCFKVEDKFYKQCRNNI